MDGNDTTTEKTQEQLDAEARARQDVSQHPRMLAMQEIADKHENDIEQQLAAEGLSSRVPVGEVDEPEDVKRQRAAREQQQREQATEPNEQTTTQATPPARKAAAAVDPQLLAQLGDEPLPMEALDGLKVKVKINGEERVVSLHDLRRAAQLDGAAHSRLEQANALLRQAREAAAQAAGKQPPVGVETKPGSGDSGATSQDVTAIAKDLVQSLFVGDEEAATATVLKLLQGRQNPAELDPQALAAQLAPAVKQQLSKEEAEAQFRSDFKDVISDPILVNAADRFFAEAQAEDPQKSYGELLTEAGQRTREWVGRVTGQKPATDPRPRSTREEKLEAKQRIDNVRSLNRTQGTQEEPIQSASQVIEDMRKARGLA